MLYRYVSVRQEHGTASFMYCSLRRNIDLHLPHLTGGFEYGSGSRLFELLSLSNDPPNKTAVDNRLPDPSRNDHLDYNR